MECRAGVLCTVIAVALVALVVPHRHTAARVVKKITDGATANKSVLSLVPPQLQRLLHLRFHVHLRTEQLSRRPVEMHTRFSVILTIPVEICQECPSTPPACRVVLLPARAQLVVLICHGCPEVLKVRVI